MDVLTDLLMHMRLRAEIFVHACYTGAWAVDTSGGKIATFHIVSRGTCWAHLPGYESPVCLRSGDILVMPNDAKHLLSNSLQMSAYPGVVNTVPNATPETAEVQLFCGYFHFDREHWNPLLDSLPEVILLREADTLKVPLMKTLEQLLSFELENEDLGSRLIINRLSEVLFINVLRSYLKRQFSSGMLPALADKQISKALAAVHESPGATHSVESLAAAAGMSRAVFSGKFRELSGFTPMVYVSKWRMTLAHQKLASTRVSVAEAAELFGYSSEASFAKAFKSEFGYGPGHARAKRATNPVQSSSDDPQV